MSTKKKLNLSGSLHERTIQLLQQRSISLPEIYKATGIPFYWLKKFQAREIRNPSVNRVQKLYEFLSGRVLDV